MVRQVQAKRESVFRATLESTSSLEIEERLLEDAIGNDGEPRSDRYKPIAANGSAVVRRSGRPSVK